MPAPTCPNHDQLLDFSLGRLSAAAEDRLVSHLDECQQCEAAIAALDDASDDLIQSIRGPKQRDAFAGEAPYRSAVARVKALGKELSSSNAVPATPAPKDAPGEQLEELRDYRLMEKIGEGGMGTVYKALHTRLDKIVALKVLPAERMRDEQAVARFHREMKAVGRLEHANIVQASDAGEADERHFLVMEYVKGVDLSGLVQRVGPLPVAEACELIRQAAVGLQFVHEQGMVHRDIKPSNLMVTSDGQVKLLDLGLALLQDQPSEISSDNISVAHEATSELTSTGQMMGTLDFMAPEQCDDSHQVDIRADIYSLGATLYKLLAGNAPFSDTRYDTPIKKMMALSTDTASPLNAIRPDVPTSLSTLLNRLLAKKPEQRFQTPAEVAAALEPFAAASDLPGWLAAHLEGIAPAPSPENLLGVGALDPTESGVTTVGDFDAYYKWLAIPPEEQPPHHYRLLGLKEFEKDPDVIEVAADRQMTHVRTFQSGKYSRESQKLLNELSTAKLCLLDKSKKAAYDSRLKAELAEKEKPTPVVAAAAPSAPPKPVKAAVPKPAPKPVQPDAPSASVFQFAEASPKTSGHKVRRKRRPIWQPLALLGGLAALVLIGAFLLTRPGDDLTRSDSSPGVDPGSKTTEEPVPGDSSISTTTDPSDPASETRVPPPVDVPPEKGNPTTPPATVRPPLKDNTPPDVPEGMVRAGARFKGIAEHKSVSVSSERQFSVAWSSDERLLATSGGLEKAGKDYTVRLWDAHNFSKLAELQPRHESSIKSITFSPDSSILASASIDGTVFLWNVQRREVYAKLQFGPAQFPAVAFSSSGERLAVGAGDGFVHIINSQSGKVETKCGPCGKEVICLAYAPDGRTIASGTFIREAIYLFDPETGESRGMLPGHKHSTTALAFSPDSNTLASGSFDPREKNQKQGSLKLWDVAEKREIITLANQLRTVRSTSFSPDGGTLAAGLQDGQLLLFDVAVRKQVAAEKKTTNQIYSAVFSPNGRQLATVGHNQPMYVWNVQYDEPQPSVASPPTQPVARWAVPDQEIKQQQLDLLKDVFREQYEGARAVPKERIALAEKLFNDATSGDLDPATRYVMLNESRKLAVNGEAPKLALQALTTMAEKFEITKDQLWIAKKATLRALKDVKSRTARQEVAAAGLGLFDEAILRAEFGAAQEIIAMVAPHAEVSSSDLLRATRIRRSKLTPLLADPDDAKANEALGAFYCFDEGNWPVGLSRLTKGADAKLRKLADEELKLPGDPTDQARLAQEWVTASTTVSRKDREPYLRRAEYWYRTALDKLPEPHKTAANQKLAEIDKLLGRDSNAKPNSELTKLLGDALLVMNFDSETIGRQGQTYRVRDLSRFENHGAINGAQPTPGIAGQALAFDGVNDFVLVEGLRELMIRDRRSISISMWMHRDELKGEGYGFDVGEVASQAVSISLLSDVFHFNLPGPQTSKSMPGGRAKLGSWHHVVGVWDGTVQRLYVDGVLTGQRASNKIISANTIASDPVRIGGQAKEAYRHKRFFKGAIDEVAVFPQAISTQQISMLLDAGRKGQSLRLHTKPSKSKKLPLNRWADLLPHLDATAVSNTPGTWKKTDAGVFVQSPIPDKTTCLDMPVNIYGNYDLRVVSKGTTGEDPPSVAIRLPVGKKSGTTLLVNGWPSRGGLTYLFKVNGVKMDENAQAISGNLLKANRAHVHELQVRASEDGQVSIRYTLDGKHIFIWQGAGHSLSPQEPLAVGVPGEAIPTAFSKVELRMVSGTGNLTGAATGRTKTGRAPARRLIMKVPAAKMRRSSATIEGNWVRMNVGEAFVSQRVTFPKAGRYVIRVSAYGEQGGNDVARMSMSINGHRRNMFEVGATKQTPQFYQVELPIAQGTHEIKFQLYNDKTAPDKSWDRNLMVGSLEVYAPAN